MSENNAVKLPEVIVFPDWSRLDEVVSFLSCYMDGYTRDLVG